MFHSWWPCVLGTLGPAAFRPAWHVQPSACPRPLRLLSCSAGEMQRCGWRTCSATAWMTRRSGQTLHMHCMPCTSHRTPLPTMRLCVLSPKKALAVHTYQSLLLSAGTVRRHLLGAWQHAWVRQQPHLRAHCTCSASACLYWALTLLQQEHRICSTNQQLRRHRGAGLGRSVRRGASARLARGWRMTTSARWPSL